MIPNELKQYLENCKTQNLSFGVVSLELTRVGWPAEKIEEAKNWYNPPINTLAGTALPPIVPKSEPVKNYTETNGFAVGSNNKGGGGKVFGIIFVVILFLLATTGAGAYFVASSKIDIKNPQIKTIAQKVVFAVPFIPKPPEYVLNMSVEAHKKVSRNSFDFSLSTKSSSFNQFLGSDQLDIQIKGATDYSNIENPKGFLNASVTKEFNIDFRFLGKKVYVKINKVPVFVYAFLKLDPSIVDPLLVNWIGDDLTPLDTPASKALKDSAKPTNIQDEKLEKLLQDLMDQDILPNLTSVNDEVDGFSTYKIQLKATPEIMNKIQNQVEKQYPKSSTYSSSPKELLMSDMIKDLVVTIWVDSKDYYVRKGTIVFNYVIPDSLSSYSSSLPLSIDPSTQPTGVSMAFVMSDFGKEVVVEEPKESLTPEQFYQKFVDTTGWGTIPPEQ